MIDDENLNFYKKVYIFLGKQFTYMDLLVNFKEEYSSYKIWHPSNDELTPYIKPHPTPYCYTFTDKFIKLISE